MTSINFLKAQSTLQSRFSTTTENNKQNVTPSNVSGQQGIKNINHMWRGRLHGENVQCVKVSPSMKIDILTYNLKDFPGKFVL